MYGVQTPPVGDAVDTFVYKQWFQSVYRYVVSRTKVITITTSYTIESDMFYIRADATGGILTVTLPAANQYSGRQILIKKVDASVNAVTVGITGTDTIEGAASVSLAAQWAGQGFISNGNNGWEKV